MNLEHVISDEVLEQADQELYNNGHGVAYNSISYFLEKGDVKFLKHREDAKVFVEANVSDYDNYPVIHAASLQELISGIPYGRYLENEITNSSFKNLSIMNEKNFAYLKDNIKYHGFGETLREELEIQLKKGDPEFRLPFKTEVNKRELEATLHFKKSDSTDMYFFNKYDVRTATERGDQTMAQTFYLNKGRGVTLKEAYNLLNGRSVHKELTDKQDQKYQAWIQLNLGAEDKNGNFERKQFHQNYGFDLKEALSYYPIKEMTNETEKEKLVRSLEKGNLQMVTMEASGEDIKIFMEANPQYKSLNLYNSKMQTLNQEQRQELMQRPEMKGMDQKQEKEQKQALDKEGQPEKKQGRAAEKKSQEQGELLPKKRTINKKGPTV